MDEHSPFFQNLCRAIVRLCEASLTLPATQYLRGFEIIDRVPYITFGSYSNIYRARFGKDIVAHKLLRYVRPSDTTNPNFKVMSLVALRVDIGPHLTFSARHSWSYDTVWSETWKYLQPFGRWFGIFSWVILCRDALVSKRKHSKGDREERVAWERR